MIIITRENFHKCYQSLGSSMSPSLIYNPIFPKDKYYSLAVIKCGETKDFSATICFPIIYTLFLMSYSS